MAKLFPLMEGGAGAAAISNPWTLAATIPLAAASSPRLMGEAANLAGLASRYIPSASTQTSALTRALMQSRMQQ